MSEMPYATFVQRLAAHIIDGLVLIPLMFPLFYVQWWSNSSPSVFLYSTVGLGVVAIAYHVGLTAWRGQTVGKMVMKIQVRRLDFSEVGLTDAVMRHSVNIMLAVVSLIITKDTLLSVPEEAFAALNWQDRATMISTPPAQHILNIATQVWVWSELLVMLTNKQRRAFHDFIAGTVVVKKEGK